MKLLLLVVFLFSFSFVGGARKCNPSYEVPCEDGHCVHKMQWCDSTVDCPDKSDEKYCNGKTGCAFHFRCNNGKCIHESLVCDKYDDCKDGSDEQQCYDQSTDEYDFDEEHTDESDLVHQRNANKHDSKSNQSVPAPNSYGSRDEFPMVYTIPRIENFTSNASKNVIDGAVHYLMRKRDSDYGWGTFTPRAVVALSLANKVVPIAEKDKQLIQKQLNIQMLLDLMEYQNVTLSNLALYINALIATCQDPQSFQGLDLVARLRKETDIAMKSNSSIPLATLTLCLTGRTTHADSIYLANMYNSKQFSRTGSKALIIMAMSCIERKEGRRIFENFMSDFIAQEILKVRTADFYTQALFKQAGIAMGFTPNSLASQQLADGSFGDLLSTYYTIPVLMNSSLLDIRCNNWNSEGMVVGTNLPRTGGKNQLRYSVWMPSGADVVSHAITIKYDGQKSLYDIMKMAESGNPMYKFFCEETTEGKRVYSLAGVPDDVESGTSWYLYNPDVDNVSVNSAGTLEPIMLGVDKIIPDEKDHYIFWLKQS